MSDVENLNKEIEELKKQSAQNAQGVEGLIAQLDAHKQSLNEALNVGLNLRTNFILVQNQAKKFANELNEANKQIASLNQQLTDATAKIAALEAPKSDAAQADAA